MKSSRSVALYLAVSCVAVLGILILFFRANYDLRDPAPLELDRPVPEGNVIIVEPNRSSERRDRISHVESPLLGLPRNSKLVNVENRIWDALEELESQRVRVIGEEDRDTKNGTQTWYLIGIEQPNSEQIAMARSMIAEALDCVEASSREILDGRISEMVEMYNTFGTQGKRAAIIQIPHDPEKQMVALVYRTNNFEEEMKKLDPATPFNHQFDQLKIYFREDSNILDRFSKIIK